MSKEGDTPDQHSPESSGNSAPKKSLAALLIPILNLLALLGTAGFFYYSKFVFKRPRITEEIERARLAKVHAAPAPPPQAILVQFEPMTINIRSESDPGPNPPAGEHYTTLAFALEIRDQTKKNAIDELKPFILDQVISIIGRKLPQELTNIQGRYVLHSQMIDSINQMIATRAALYVKEGLVTNLYFTQFLVQ